MFRRPFWWKKNIFRIWFFFEFWANFFPTFGKKYSANLAELLSKRSGEQYVVQPTTSLKNSSYLFEFWPKLFLNLRILFLQKCENCFLRTDTNTSIKKIFFEKFSSFFGIGSKIFLAFGRNSRKDCQNCFLRIQKYVEETGFFNFFFSFRCVIGLWAKLFWHVAQNFPQSCQNCFPRVQTNNMLKKNRILKKFLYQNLRIFFQSKHYFSTKLTKLLFKRWDENFDEKMFFFEKLFLNFVWDVERNAFGNKISQSCQNWILRVQTKSLMKKHFFEKNFVHFFYFVRKLFWLLTIFFKVDKTVFQVVRPTLWWKKIFFEKRFLKFLSDFGRNISQLSIQFLRRDCQNRFLHDQETFRGNRLSHFLCFQYICGFWAKVLTSFA